MKIVLSLAAAALAAGAAFSTPALALPIGPAPVDTPTLVDEAGWAQGFERGGKRFLSTTKRHAPRRDVTSTGNVERPDRPRGQAQWGQMPGGRAATTASRRTRVGRLAARCSRSSRARPPTVPARRW